jgi:hypothetical protein
MPIRPPQRRNLKTGRIFYYTYSYYGFNTYNKYFNSLNDNVSGKMLIKLNKGLLTLNIFITSADLYYKFNFLVIISLIFMCFMRYVGKT